MLALIESGTLHGIDAIHVQIEVNTGEKGDLRWVIVGLPDASVKESQNRVFSSLGNSGFILPNSRTTINLAPGDLRKEGPFYDLPIALAIVAATKQANIGLAKDFLIAGELSLSGATRPISGALNIAILAKKMKKRGIIVPKNSAFEAAFVDGIEVYGVDSLSQTVEFLAGRLKMAPLERSNDFFEKQQAPEVDISELKGQKVLKRVMEIAVAGNHNLIMVGPPGCGKSMLAKCIPGIMPEPSYDELIEILKIKSVCGLVNSSKNVLCRPFRAPHHSISDAGLMGGGTYPRPGEISLSHHGVLFLDELPEFKRTVLEMLRQPMEDGVVTISRSNGSVTFPCRGMIVAAMNPCPCGYFGSSQKKCNCGSTQIQRYRAKISGPLLDRMDIQIEVNAVPLSDLNNKEFAENSSAVRQRIKTARAIQLERFSHTKSNKILPFNAYLSPKLIEKHCEIGANESSLIHQACEQLNLSIRAYHKILKVARTIADLENSNKITESNIIEAIQYRCLDRKW